MKKNPGRKERRKLSHGRTHHNCFTKKYGSHKKLARAFDLGGFSVSQYFKHIGFKSVAIRNPSFRLLSVFKNWMKRFNKKGN